MTVGAAGAINTVLKSMLDPGDEVIVLNPYFPEYRFYIENHQPAASCRWKPDADFQPDVGRIAAAITPRTRAIILNSPNNPTGAVYSARRAARARPASCATPSIVISDEPYRPLVFDGDPVRPRPLALVERSVVAWSWSKAMAMAGERIGYLAISPRLAELADAAQRLHVHQPHPRLHQRPGHLAVGGGAGARCHG